MPSWRLPAGVKPGSWAMMARRLRSVMGGCSSWTASVMVNCTFPIVAGVAGALNAPARHVSCGAFAC